jgi:ABC-type polysaccharide/polyol phosphate export permease
LIPANYVWIMKFNPVFHYIEAFRSVLYFNEVPDLTLMLTILGITSVTIMLGLWVFFYLQKGFISNY